VGNERTDDVPAKRSLSQKRQRLRSNPFFLRVHRKHSSLERRLCQTPESAVTRSSMPRGSLLQLVYQSAIAERMPFVILNHAHRQIHAENAGGAAGGAGPRVATEQFRNHERTFSFRSSGPKRWNSSAAPREDWGKC